LKPLRLVALMPVFAVLAWLRFWFGQHRRVARSPLVYHPALISAQSSRAASPLDEQSCRVE
jgi:hypothetical protein